MITIITGKYHVPGESRVTRAKYFSAISVLHVKVDTSCTVLMVFQYFVSVLRLLCLAF